MSGAAAAGSNPPSLLDLDLSTLQVAPPRRQTLWPGGPSLDSLNGVDLSRPGITVLPLGDSAQVPSFLAGGSTDFPFLLPPVSFTAPNPNYDAARGQCLNPTSDAPSACQGPVPASPAPQPSAPATVAPARPAPPRVDPARQRFQAGVMAAGEAASFDRQTRCLAHGSPLENELIRAFGLNPDEPDAVQILQRTVGTTPDGRMGPQTINAIAHYIRQHAAEIVTSNPEQLVTFERSLQFLNQASLQPIPQATVNDIRQRSLQGFSAEDRTAYTAALANEQLNPAGPRHVSAPQS